jgi:F0F1-type ATP synthase gamma subunit
MKNAHDSAKDIISDLTLFYNKARQNSITTELADAVSSRLGQTQ